jgi:hypothetical protein
MSRLDGVNDPDEARASDLMDAQTMVFASCWTAQARESLAIWHSALCVGLDYFFQTSPAVSRSTLNVASDG